MSWQPDPALKSLVARLRETVGAPTARWSDLLEQARAQAQDSSRSTS